MTLNSEPNIAAPDDLYQDLINLHRDLSDEESALVNAKLILLLAISPLVTGVIRTLKARLQIWIGCEMCEQDFDGDRAFEPGVFGLIDLAHAASTEYGDDFIRS